MADIIHIKDFTNRATRSRKSRAIVRHPSEAVIADIVQLDEYRVARKELLIHPSIVNKSIVI